MAQNKVISDYKVVIIGGSAGSLQALMNILPAIPAITTFALVIVLHRRSTDDLTLERLIKIRTKIPVEIIEDKLPFLPGYLYIAPSNYHLLFEKNGTLALDSSEKVNYSRPSIDVTFESAAEVYGRNLVGILLSGSNADGTAGIKAIQAAGGVIIIQDPISAEMPFMPNHAIQNSTPDYIMHPHEILDFINSIDTL
ncbi:chemotaxis protein CheB [Flavobacterium sp.]|uniref:chemotaxis protein CheB n=1 Tax=Flavobacterium sp. TaxID=239 RepID=UPI002CB18A4C|nr:chemotaxis protein CheB [Flavobacterium sp.]HSD09249.1 chemotaxis protein CheB [Flavobacterium sp.]